MMHYSIKLLSVLFSVTLFAFASLQFNDPDPVIWVGFYSICAIVPLLVVFNKFIYPLFWVAVLICCIQLLIAVNGAYTYYLHMADEPLMQGMNAEKPYIEEAREFLGALIALILVLMSRIFMRYIGRKS